MPESLNENKGLTPEMLKGVDSIFDAASSPTEECSENSGNAICSDA